MKAAPFAYVRPSTLDDAVSELAATDGEGKVLAGGQSLVPVLAMRLGRPSTLVDLGGVGELDTVERRGESLRIGAMARQRRLERDPNADAVPLLAMALPFVGHRELRTRGTICGSLAHADPAAELPAVACCLVAQLEITGPQGIRTVPAAEFFAGAMTTSVGPDEVLSAVELPVAKSAEGFGFGEIARRHGDFALAGVVVRVRTEPSEGVLTAFGVSDRPVTRDVTGLLDLDGDALRDAIAELAGEVVDTEGDPHGSPGYRRRLLTALGARELSRARERARS